MPDLFLTPFLIIAFDDVEFISQNKTGAWLRSGTFPICLIGNILDLLP